MRTKTPPSLTGEPLLLHTGVLHRVDSHQVPADFTGAAIGQAMCSGIYCHSHPQCADTHCTGHPNNLGHSPGEDDPAIERDPMALRWVLAFLAVFWLGLAGGLYRIFSSIRG